MDLLEYCKKILAANETAYVDPMALEMARKILELQITVDKYESTKTANIPTSALPLLAECLEFAIVAYGSRSDDINERKALLASIQEMIVDLNPTP